jgi:tetratricopeptide (TPR) repeat protein
VSKESVMFGIAGVFFGLLAGWMIGSQHARSAAAPPAASTAAAAPAQGQAQTAAPFDESRAAALQAAIAKNSADVQSRVQLADMNFDSERFAEAAKWYEDALKVDPKNVSASTDLGIAYYYMNQPDRALAQFARSLTIDPKHTKTHLNIGIVRAFAKQDLNGAAVAWREVIAIAPDSAEARMARQALDGMQSAHPDSAKDSAPAPKTK